MWQEDEIYKQEYEQLSEINLRERRHKRLEMRNKNIARFKKDYPQFNKLTNTQVLLIFKMFKENIINRTFFASNVSLLFAGTLIILITSLFMNAGAIMKISNDDKSPN